MGEHGGSPATERGDLTGLWSFDFAVPDATATVANGRAHDVLVGVLDCVEDLYVPIELRL